MRCGFAAAIRKPIVRGTKTRTSFRHLPDSYIFKSSLSQMPIKFRPDSGLSWARHVCAYVRRVYMRPCDRMKMTSQHIESLCLFDNRNEGKAILMYCFVWHSRFSIHAPPFTLGAAPKCQHNLYDAIIIMIWIFDKYAASSSRMDRRAYCGCDEMRKQI